MKRTTESEKDSRGYYVYLYEDGEYFTATYVRDWLEKTKTELNWKLFGKIDG